MYLLFYLSIVLSTISTCTCMYCNLICTCTCELLCSSYQGKVANVIVHVSTCSCTCMYTYNVCTHVHTYVCMFMYVHNNYTYMLIIDVTCIINCIHSLSYTRTLTHMHFIGHVLWLFQILN